MSASSTVHRLRPAGMALPIGLLLLALGGGDAGPRILDLQHDHLPERIVHHPHRHRPARRHVGHRVVGRHPAAELDAKPDLAFPMLRLAHGKIQTRCAAVQSDAGALPLADESFDGVTLALATHEMPQPVRAQVLAEAQRVLSETRVAAEATIRAGAESAKADLAKAIATAASGQPT